MKTVTVEDRSWAEMVSWLQQNVGPLQWSRPILEWKGKNWYMQQRVFGSTIVKGYRHNRLGYEVAFDNEHHALMFALRWL